MPEISVGIDLGTTNSCISTCWPNGQPRLLRDEAGIGVIPSVVSFLEDGRVEVGLKGKMRRVVDPENTFHSVKRFVGRDMRTDDNRWSASRYAYRIDSGPNGLPMASTRGRKFPLYQISGTVLRYLKEIGERGVGHEIRKAVITVPANFNEVQRRATHQAGEFAGFEVLRIFNEPTAAALAYGLGRDRNQTVAVYDFGGGTFDITILRLEDPVFEVMATSGDTMLGGDDLDRRLIEDMFEQFRGRYGFDPSGDISLVQRFTLGAERMKCQLTDWIVTAFEDRHIKAPDGRSLPPFHYETNREKFRAIVTDLVERSFTVCDDAFGHAGIEPREVDEVILVGGTTRIPFLRERVHEYFGRRPLDKIQPDVVVSIGASIQAYALVGGDMVYPAAANDMLPIRKVEPRPPAPRSSSGREFELLEDLSQELKAAEDGTERALKRAKTLPGGVPPAPAKGKTLPWPQPASWPSSSSVSQLDEPLSRREPADEAVLTRPVTGTGLRSPAPVPALPSRARPVDKPASLEDLLPIVSAVAEPAPVAEPPPRTAPEEPFLLETFGPPTQEETSEAMELSVEVLLDKPEKAPLVTAEQAMKPYLTRRDLEDVRSVEMPPPAGESPPRPETRPAKAPLLLDVTANTLGVATVGGFVEVLVKKNSPVPIEKRHMFTTGADFQERAIIRVMEGESNRSEENHSLGEVELVDIRKAMRGEIKIEVMFEITVDGILEVSARNLETGEAQKTRLTLFGG